MTRLYVFLFLSLFLFGQSIFATEPFRFEENKETKQLSLSEGTLPVLTYQYDVIEHDNVPKDDLRRTAGCYVHPLHGINGEILTDNVPKDHYHHHGIFWAWSHVGIHEPDSNITEYNLWESNTALKQHFVRWIDKTITDQTALFEVENGWFIGDPKEGKKMMIERVRIIVHRIQQGDVTNRSVDFEFQWQPTDKPITLRGVEGKSYGGFTMRFRPFVAAGKSLAEPNEINRITTPSGITAGDLPETPLAWADYTSLFGDQSAEKTQPSGAAIFIPKTHPDFPPTWLTRYYGPLCVGYPGVKGRTFQPSEKIELRYRIWIHDGAVTMPQMEKAYNEYSH
jgi:hypothetical protein